MIGVQLRTRDGHATSDSITALAYRCALLLTDSLPLSWRKSGDIGWFLATDDESTRQLGSALLRNYSQSTGLPGPELVYAPCEHSSPGVARTVSGRRCALLHMALLAAVDDVVVSKKSTFGDIGHAVSGLASMTLSSQLTCMRQRSSAHNLVDAVAIAVQRCTGMALQEELVEGAGGGEGECAWVCIHLSCRLAAECSTVEINCSDGWASAAITSCAVYS